MDLKRPATNGETDMFYEGSNPSGVTIRKDGRAVECFGLENR